MRMLLGSPAAQFRELLHLYPDFNFATPTRSTIPLLDYWHDADKRLPPLLSKLNLPADTTDTSLCFEYPVASLDGAAKCSFTDLMILHQTSAIAIEGKRTEGRDKSIETRLTVGDSKRQLAVVLTTNR